MLTSLRVLNNQPLLNNTLVTLVRGCTALQKLQIPSQLPATEQLNLRSFTVPDVAVTLDNRQKLLLSGCLSVPPKSVSTSTPLLTQPTPD